MKLLCSFPAEQLELYAEDLRHQLYLMAIATQWTETAQKIKNAKRVKIKIFTCKDDCAGQYLRSKIEVSIEE